MRGVARGVVRMGTLGLLGCGAMPSGASEEERPNVVIVITDDQGWGDFSFHGNPVLETPHLDAMARGSARATQFYVHPVCAPTRASLMTGRWSQRTGAIDTYIGRAMMRPDEVTLAEALQGDGYATGIFGKWHLGDCHPMRPTDQGFETSLVHRGGGIGQSSDPVGGEGRYTDAVLFANGERVETSGYCTDVYFDAATEWMAEQADADRPFFAYVATNAPHTPLHDVPQDRYAEYASMDLAPERFRTDVGQPLPESWNADRLARIYAMIANIDDNVGRLFARLEAMGELEDTLVVFLVDNGSNGPRFAAGLRGRKTEVHEGGVRSPLWLHWPGTLEPGAEVAFPTAHVDLFPTVLDACGVAAPADRALDGRSLLPALLGRETAAPERALVIQAHRGDHPVRHHHALVRRGDWKLVSPTGFGRDVPEVDAEFELYDIASDPYEQHDLAAERPDVVERLLADYDAWWDDTGAGDSAAYAPTPISIGHPAAPEVHLTRQDWRLHDRSDHAHGSWRVDVRSAGPYDVHVRFRGDTAGAERAVLRVGELEYETSVPDGATEVHLGPLHLPLGTAQLTARLDATERSIDAYQIELR